MAQDAENLSIPGRGLGIEMEVVEIRSEKCLGSATTLYEPLPFPLSSRARRGICGSADLSWKRRRRCSNRILISSNELSRRVEREMTNLFIKAPMRLVAHSIPHFARVAEHPPPSHEDQSRRDETCLSIVFCVSRRGPRNRRSLAWLGMTKERATVLKEWLLNRGAFKSNLDRFKVQPSLRD
ncbi:MAG: hypothetical protein QOJ51_3815 [Acidobacteriaceae bacterium]|nr:hypothetical protein [Acidobacteriaceae bacterium]